MARATQTVIELFNLSPLTSGTNDSVAQRADGFDHVVLNMALTMGSITSLDFYPQFSNDGSTWRDVYDANGDQVTWNFTADFTGWRYFGQAENVTRVQPITLSAELWRIVAEVVTGSPTGSSLVVDYQPYILGSFASV